MLGKALLFVLALSGVLLGSGCGSSASEDLPTTMPPASASNPRGQAYPEDHLGTRQRQGRTPGDRIANLSFRGLRRGATAGSELETLSLADYYDPTATDHSVLYIFAAASWCAICARVARELESHGAELEARGARILVVLVNGESQGAGPSLGEFEQFAQRHPVPLDLAVDVRATALGAYGLQGVPFNLLIDARSMEILDASVGEADLDTYVGAGTSFTAANPVSYPVSPP